MEKYEDFFYRCRNMNNTQLTNRDIEYLTSGILEIAEHEVPVDENIFPNKFGKKHGKV